MYFGYSDDKVNIVRSLRKIMFVCFNYREDRLK